MVVFAVVPSVCLGIEGGEGGTVVVATRLGVAEEEEEEEGAPISS